MMTEEKSKTQAALEIIEEVEIEDLAIDGICGVY